MPYLDEYSCLLAGIGMEKLGPQRTVKLEDNPRQRRKRTSLKIPIRPTLPSLITQKMHKNVEQHIATPLMIHP